MTQPNRRALLVGAAVAALPLPAAVSAPALSPDTVATCHRIRGFCKEHMRLLSAEAALEDDPPEHFQACAATDAVWSDFKDERLARLSLVPDHRDLQLASVRPIHLTRSLTHAI